jgi:2,4-dienoyl-CoA reductase-like NADH-dependent reductase (Old Yellow Enzyme family)
MRERFDMPIIDVTVGNPYKNPHVSRPYNKGNYVPDEHPLVGVARHMECAAQVQAACQDIAVVCSGLSYLRQYSGCLAAGMVKSGKAAFAGFGRLTLAYPEFPRDLLSGNPLDTGKICLACGQCSRLLRAGQNAGCVIRDREAYKPASG